LTRVEQVTTAHLHDLQIPDLQLGRAEHGYLKLQVDWADVLSDGRREAVIQRQTRL
jgi:hypothetical protein